MLLYVKMTPAIRKLIKNCVLIFQNFVVKNRFYIILQGSVDIFRADDEGSKPIQIDIDTVTEFAKLDDDPEKRELIIAQTFGNYVVTLGK
jgi:hypothetical protein